MTLETAQSPDGAEIAFERRGAGDTLIIVGGAFNTRHTPMKLAEILSADFEVVTYDRRGRGDSTDVAPYEPQKELDDLKAVITATGGSANVYGHSSGAGLALAAAANSADISALALYEAPYFVGDDRMPLAAGFADELDELVSQGRRGDAAALFLTTAVGVPEGAVAGMRNQPMWAGLEGIAHTLSYDIRIMGDNSLPVDAARTVGIPVLAIAGGNSPVWARNAVAAIAELLPNADSFTLEGQTHDVSPQAIAPVLTEFFQG